MPAPEPWHFLYFLPLPQGQGSLRPVLADGFGLFDVALPSPPAEAVDAGAFFDGRFVVVVPPSAPGVSPGPDSWTLAGGGGGAAWGVSVTWKMRFATFWEMCPFSWSNMS